MAQNHGKSFSNNTKWMENDESEEKEMGDEAAEKKLCYGVC